MKKDKYEISIWEDYFVSKTDVIPAHYEERKICIIGSDKMEASCRAFEPRFVENINGTHTLTFKMYYTLQENELSQAIYLLSTGAPEFKDLYESREMELAFIGDGVGYGGKRYKNPFIPYLVNERKIKALWKDKWYDLIIKTSQEDSLEKSITYTCTDLFINELSKTGFDITLNAELNNNQGNVLELGQTVLKDTDWHIDINDSDIIQQYSEEPVYEAITLASRIVINDSQSSEVNLANNSKILVFYKQIQDFLNTTSIGQSKIQSIQFAFSDHYTHDGTNQLVTNADCYSIDNIRWTHVVYDGVECIAFGETPSQPWLRIFYKAGVSANYRAKRLVKSQISRLDTLTGKYCNVWEATQDGTGDYQDLISKGDEIYSFKLLNGMTP